MLIVFEGIDSSGKETHSQMAYGRLLKEGYPARKVSFPNYESKAAGALNMYLDGDFGKSPGDVNPYVASTFYAIDRFASFKTDWASALESNDIIIADRYTTSNMIHQGAKLDNEDELRAYIVWLCDLEFDKFKLPKPDRVIFLDMPMNYRIELLNNRKGKVAGNQKKDIHENDMAYLEAAHLCAQKIARDQGWSIVSVVNGDGLKSIEDVHNEVYAIILETITSINNN